MKITIIAVGKIKERFYREAVAEYKKRLSRYARLSIVEVADEPCPEQASEAEMRSVKRREGERILKKLPDQAHAICLAIEGKSMDSVALSKHLSSLALSGEPHVAFLIGGSLGLDDAVRARCRSSLSFSAMTFPHQLMRVILLEQVYRSFRIMRGEPYHK